MANNILKYSSKDYESIKSDLLDAISALSSTWTSREDGDPGIVLVKLMAALGDMLSFNTDKQALEYYAPTVTQRKNAARLFNLIGYRMHWFRAAETTITLNYKAVLPEWVYYYKRIVDGESAEDVYYEYEQVYTWDDNGTPTISLPPTIDNNGNIQMPESMVADGYQEKIGWDISEEYNGAEIDRTSSAFIEHARDFASGAKTVYRYWQKDNALGLHLFINDPQAAFGVYGKDYNSIPYSLIPTISNATTTPNGGYNPTTYILPYTPTPMKAIQGSLRSVTFTKSQIKSNRFYVPDSELDETYMYLSYIVTDDNNIQQEKTVFLEKADNLLTVTNFLNDDGSTKVYFEFNVDEFDFPYIELSSYWKDVISEDAVTFRFYYFKTKGSVGCITDDYLATIGSSAGSEVVVTNIANSDYVLDSSGRYLCKPGFNPQTAYDAYVDSMNYIMTFDTIVTIYDFKRFTRRQDGVSNAFACDGQHANDLNNEIRAICDNYTKSQLLDILGENANANLSRAELADVLYNIRKITFDLADASIYGGETEATKFVNYGINLYPIWNNFQTQNYDGKQIAYYTNFINDEAYPYYIYGVYAADDITGDTNKSSAVADEITNALRDTRIVNTVPYFKGCRVFPWRCCGTLHLNQMVTEKEADSIIKNVVDYLSKRYAPENMEFGKKVTYMELIDSVVSADSRIRYFDAGIGNKKLIDFVSLGSGVFNTEAYFNPISIMRYTQTYEEIKSNISPYRNMITVDPNYIQKQHIFEYASEG